MANEKNPYSNMPLPQMLNLPKVGSPIERHSYDPTIPYYPEPDNSLSAEIYDKIKDLFSNQQTQVNPYSEPDNSLSAEIYDKIKGLFGNKKEKYYVNKKSMVGLFNSGDLRNPYAEPDHGLTSEIQNSLFGNGDHYAEMDNPHILKMLNLPKVGEPYTRIGSGHR